MSLRSWLRFALWELTKLAVALRLFRRESAEEPVYVSWSTVGIADTSTGETIFRHEQQGDLEMPLLADDGSAVAVRSGDTIAVWSVKARVHVGWMIAVVLGVWLTTFLFERLVRRVRRPRIPRESAKSGPRE